MRWISGRRYCTACGCLASAGNIDSSWRPAAVHACPHGCEGCVPEMTPGSGQEEEGTQGSHAVAPERCGDFTEYSRPHPGCVFVSRPHTLVYYSDVTHLTKGGGGGCTKGGAGGGEGAKSSTPCACARRPRHPTSPTLSSTAKQLYYPLKGLTARFPSPRQGQCSWWTCRRQGASGRNSPAGEGEVPCIPHWERSNDPPTSPARHAGHLRSLPRAQSGAAAARSPPAAEGGRSRCDCRGQGGRSDWLVSSRRCPPAQAARPVGGQAP